MRFPIHFGVIVGGRVTASGMLGYMYEKANVLSADGASVLGSCRTGRVTWSLRRLN